LKEDILQSQIYKYYHNNYCTKLNNPPHLIFSVPNGGFRNKIEAMKMKATGLLAGVSDLIVIQPNRIIFIELKILKGNQSSQQKEFEEKIKKLGFEYYVCKSLEEFKIIIKNDK
jgi:hypothetical protein